jgi:spermidine synthase
LPGDHVVPSRAAFLVVVVLSGAAALVYEVLWLRMLTLSMGHTTAAVGTVLAAFMGGLALGAWIGGRRAANLTPQRALRTYASLELTIAVCAIVLPISSASLQPVLAWAYNNGEGALAFDLARVTLSLLLISVPATAMGATYPIAVRAFAVDDLSAATSASRVYAANTLGAALGAALGGFVLLPLLGMRGATFAGVALNGLAAAMALVLARRGWLARASGAGGSGFRLQPEGPVVLAAVTLSVSGFVALVYEVIWTRILAMVLGPTTYAFSAMLVAFIVGLAIGASIAAALLPRTRHPGAWLGVVLVAAAGAALTAALFVDRLPLVMAAAVTQPGTTFGSIAALQIGLGIAMQLPLTIALGATFPLAIAYVAPDRTAVTRSVGIVYATNTVGAIAGALAGSFVLIPAFGLQTSLRLAAALTCATGAGVLWRTLPHSTGRVAAATTAAAIIVAAILLPQWNQERLANGAYRYAPALAAGDVDIGLDAGQLLYYREGAAGTVSVRQLPGARSLAIDGKVDASNAEDMLTQKLLAHLPLLLHPDPREVLVIGLGSGVTVGSALRHPIRRATVLELSPEVVAASAFFERENGRALSDPRTRLVLGDGRSHLLLSADRYDVIISEPSNPWMAGVAALFTREFFTAARARLAPAGILCQWAHTYNISDADLRSIVATFLDVFPDGSAWLVGESDLLLIGPTTTPRALEQGLGHAWDRPRVTDDLAQVELRDPFSLLTLFVANGDALRRYAHGAVVQTDDRLALEYSAPRAIYSRFQDSNVMRLRQIARDAELPAAVRDAHGTATPHQWRNRGRMLLGAGAAGPAFNDLRRAAEQDPLDRETLDGLARAAARSGQLEAAEELLRRVATASRSVPAMIELSRVLASRGQSNEATDIARSAVVTDPTNTAALEQLAWMYADRGDVDALTQLARVADQLPAHRAVELYARASIAHLRGDLEHAATAGEELVRLARNANALNLLGSIRAARGEYDAARRALEESLALVPADAVIRTNLGEIELRSNNPAAAVERFSEALFVRPAFAPALDGLARSFEQLGERRRRD